MRATSACVATVADRPIPLTWVEARLALLVGGRLGRHLPPGESNERQRLRRWIVQELVTRMVLLHEAEQAGLWSWEDAVLDHGSVADRAPDIPDDVLGHLFDRVTAHVVIPGAEIDAYIERDPDTHRRPEARRIRYVIAESAARSRAWLDALREGSTPEDGGEVRRGEMWLRRGEFVGPLEDAIFEADVHGVVGPFELEQGWTVARLEAITPASGTSTAEARAWTEAELVRYARARAFDAWLDARRAALAEIHAAYEHPGHPVHGIVQHRH